MIKRVTLSILVCLLFVGGASAQRVEYRNSFSARTAIPEAAGSWNINAGRLYQSDADEQLAKINVMAAQSGEMQYSFDVRYEDGAFEDMMGGFGIHIFVDDAFPRRSWGNGDSFLLWLNFDTNASYGSNGLQAQIYKSSSHTEMQLVAEYDLNRYANLISIDNSDVIVSARIKVDGRSGSVWVEDPTLPGYGYRFSLGGPLDTGDYVSLRTNSLALSFDNIEIARIR
jgi:hypothetical protein